MVSQEVQYVLGNTWVGSALFFLVQAATVMILFTGGNTSFNGFPYLASFVAGDSFLPRQLTRRGHRLAFSNGIFVLAAVAILLIIVFKAQPQLACRSLRDRRLHGFLICRVRHAQAPSRLTAATDGGSAW